MVESLLRTVVKIAVASLIWVPIGVWIGKAFVLRVNKELYERVILFFLVISALLVLLT